MKTRTNAGSQERWLELMEKHKDSLSIENIQKVRNSIKRNDNSWAILFLKLDMLCCEYPLKGESDEKRANDH